MMTKLDQERRMETINLYEAKTNLSSLVERAAAGEEIIIAKAGRPLARLVPLAPQGSVRRLGLFGDDIRVADNFDAPLPAEIQDAFDGKAP
jgi:prevent-host-death family protein